jgi:4-methyl-5(b-hydroxyethyl)-thiazole monophosphate biosynthesis
MTSKTVLVPIADGSEEIETSCITDTLTRFGAKVTVASVKPNGELLCTMSRGLMVQAQKTIAEAAQDTYDLIVLPGGMPGAEHLRDSAELKKLLEQHAASQKLYGAVCAAPAIVLASHGLIPDGAPATSFPVPKFRGTLAKASDDRVVIADNVVTSQGPGTSLEFALALGEKLFGKEKRDEIAAQLLVKE